MCIKFIVVTSNILYNYTDTYNSCGNGNGCPAQRSKNKW